jgi:hypothetical protein
MRTGGFEYVGCGSALADSSLLGVGRLWPIHPLLSTFYFLLSSFFFLLSTFHLNFMNPYIYSVIPIARLYTIVDSVMFLVGRVVPPCDASATKGLAD